MGHRPEKVEQADGQGQLSPHEYTGDIAQPARCCSVFIFRCLWSLPCSENPTWEPRVYSIYSPFSTFQYIRSRMLNMAMKEVDRDFWTAYQKDKLTYSGKPCAHFAHLTQVVLAHGATGIKIQQKPSCSSLRWST